MTEVPILILDGSRQPFLSLGCRFGGVKAFGHDYTYYPERDFFLRKDYVKVFKKHNKEGGSWEDFVEKIKAVKQ